ncbi:sigma-70 family RNA polymerase sigma factor [Myxococcaceae bacterium GXIMD 01537]
MTELPEDARPGWLERFHAGEPSVLEKCYREHFDTVMRAVGATLSGADQETVVHEVFLRLISQPAVRRSFQGGSFAAWLSTVSRNLAVDSVRARQREGTALGRFASDSHDSAPAPSPLEGKLEARRLVEKFRRERLPPQWAGVFEARFLRQLSQREAAAELHMRRTTLAYQELRIRHLLRKFLLAQETE